MRLGRRDVARRDAQRKLPADRGRRREHCELGGAAMHLVRVVADDGDPVPGSVSRPGAYGDCRNTGAPTTSSASNGASVSRSRGRSAGRKPANSG